MEDAVRFYGIIMGKKVVSGRESIVAMNEKSKKQLSHLIRALRPKVYITDVSNFKRLVQQLTGNGSSSSSSLLPSQSPLQTDVVDDDHNIHGGEASSFDASSFDHQLCNNDVVDTSFLEELLEAENRVLQNTFDHIPSSSSSMNQPYWDWLAFQEMESWLLDVDHHHHQAFPRLNGFLQNHQEIGAYDYELSWTNNMN